jgi:uncharacterized protein (TIGR00297 family)
MGEEMQGVEGDTGWRKAIPEKRDWLQSRVLVGVVGTLLLGISVLNLTGAYTRLDRFPANVYSGIGISLAFAIVVWLLKAATPVGAAYGGMICLQLMFWTSSSDGPIGRSAVTPLAVLFVLTFISTRAGRYRKAKSGLAEKKSGRSAAQVIANLSVAALCVTPIMIVLIGSRMMEIMCLAALAEATADTVSSEIGQAFGGDPVLIAGLRLVEAGTDGAVTFLGSCAGVAGGAMVAIAGEWAMRLDARAMLTALGAAVCGLFFDSLLGATVERRGWLGNDLVNFTSTLFAALLAVVFYRFLVL